MKPDLKTMEEKLRENPDELMENGLTRAQNDQAEKDSAAIGTVLSFVSLGIAIYSLMLLFS